MERKYDNNFRVKLISKLEKIKDKNKLIDIYRIISKDSTVEFSSNSNGLFYNINLFNDGCIKALVDYTQNLDDVKLNQVTYTPYSKTGDSLFKKSDQIIVDAINNV